MNGRWLALAAVVAGLGLWGTGPAVPSFGAVRAAYRPSEARLLDRAGEVLHELRIDRRQRRFAWTSLGDVPEIVRAAAIAGEDRRFWRHGGVDWWVWGAWLRGRPRGGSTITMQLAARIDPRIGAPGRAVSAWRSGVRKVRQVRVARALERHWRKDDILEAYLNLVPLRGEIEGIGAAAGVLFDKAPHGLTAAEGVVTAALIPAPNASHVHLAARAGRLAMAVVPALGAIEIDAAARRVVEAAAGHGPRVSAAPHVARRLLRAGVPAAVATTLDRRLQELATEALHRQLLAVRGQHVADGAVLVVDNLHGDVLAYVGSSGVLSEAPAVDGVRALRQPGSTLKPFLYGAALEQRLLTLASPLDDTPLEVATIAGLYRPRNYDETFRGPVPLRVALAASLNIPAVRTLLLLGANRFAEQLRTLGFVGVVQDGDWYGPGLALGAAEVSLWEQVGAYRMLARGGAWGPLRLTDEPATAAARQGFSRGVAWLVGDVLADREARAATFGLDSPLATPFWSAVKTGTSKDMRDNWCIGFTSAVTVGVWVGNASGQPMHDVSGVTGAAPVWQELMAEAHARWPSPPPPAPPELVRAARGEGGAEWFVRGTEPRGEPAGRAVPRPAIVAPANATTIAIDPDLPLARQCVAFRVRGAPPDAQWQLDGQPIGAAHGTMLWAPTPGRHALALMPAGFSRPLDQVRFEVRGQPVGSGGRGGFCFP